LKPYAWIESFLKRVVSKMYDYKLEFVTTVKSNNRIKEILGNTRLE